MSISAAIRPQEADLLERVDAIARACAMADTSHLYAAIDAFVHPEIGHSLCTFHRYVESNCSLVRLYSSNSEAYPPGGSKSKKGLPWGRHVLLERKIFVGEGEDAIRTSFDDHATIKALGLRSVINVPVVAQDQCLGTANFLMTDATVTPQRIAMARLAALLAMPAMLRAHAAAAV